MDSYQVLRNKLNKLNLQLKREYFVTKISSINRDMKETWKARSQLINKSSKTTSTCLLIIEDQSITDKIDISNAINCYFCSVGKNLNKPVLLNVAHC